MHRHLSRLLLGALLACTAAAAAEPATAITCDFAVPAAAEEWSGDAKGGQIAAGDGALVYRRDAVNRFHYLARKGQVAVSDQALYTVEARIAIAEPLEMGDFRLAIVPFSAAGKDLGALANGPRMTSTDGWQTIAYTTRLPAGTSKAQLRLCNRGKGAVRIQRVEFRPARGEELKRVPRYLGSVAERQTLASPRIFAATGDPAPVVCFTDQDRPADAEHAIDIFWERQGGAPAPFLRTSFEIPWRRPAAITSFSFAVKIVADQPVPSAAVRVYEGPTTSNDRTQSFWEAGVSLADPHPERWRTITIPATAFTPRRNRVEPDSYWQLIDRLVLEPIVDRQQRINLLIANPTAHLADGSALAIGTPGGDPFALFWEAPEARNTLPSVPRDQGRVLIGTALGPGTERRRQSFLAIAKALGGNLGLHFNGRFREAAIHHDWLAGNDIAVGFQNGELYAHEFVAAHQAYNVGRAGSKNDDPAFGGKPQWHHYYDFANPAYDTFFDTIGARAARYGIPEIQFIDCYFGGGRSRWDMAAYRSYLDGSDPGCVVADLRGQPRTLRFWDYVRSYTGRVLAPADVGCASWDAYLAGMDDSDRWRSAKSSPAERRQALLGVFLRSFEFSMFFARTGAVLQRHGIDLSMMPNGDDWITGNDHYLLTAMRDIDVLVQETFFYHPRCILEAQSLGVAWEIAHQAAKRVNPAKQHRLVVETGEGGSGIPYLSSAFSFLYQYTLTAARAYDSLEIDWLYQDDIAPFEEDARGFAAYEKGTLRWKDLVMKALGYKAALADRLRIPDEARRLVLLENTTSKFAGPNPYSLSEALVQSGLPFSRATAAFLDSPLLDQAEVVVHGYINTPPPVAAGLRAWLAAKPGRSLVLWGSSPFRTDDMASWSAVWKWDLDSANAEEPLIAALGRPARAGGPLAAGPLACSEARIADLLPASGPAMAQTPFTLDGGAEVLVAQGGRPLLSRLRVGAGTVYYLHYNPDRSAPELDRALLRAIARLQGVRETGVSLGARRSLAQRFAGAQGEVFLLFDATSFADYQYHYGNDNNAPFPWRDAAAAIAVQVRLAEANRRYRFYDFMADRTWTATSDADGSARIDIAGATACLVYAFADDAEAGRRIQALRQRRADAFRWLPE